MKRILSSFLLAVLLLACLSFVHKPVQAATNAPVVINVTLKGPLTPVWSTQLERGINQAVDLNAELLVIELDTPGGSVDLMNSLVQQILASPVPIAVFVSPRGSMAASAGTLIVLAGHIAAMTPESAIGAASPVGSQGEDLESTVAEKAKEILKASVRSLALRRGEKAVKMAEEAIESAKAASAQEALAAGLVDYIASGIPDLLKQIDGDKVMVEDEQMVLNTAGGQVVPLQPTFIENILGTLTNANIVFILLSLGVQALLIELSHPGGWVAGFFGAIFMALAIYGLGILSVNWFGIVFLIIAFILFILDIKAPTHGALTLAGTGSFITGALVLFNSAQVPTFSNVSVPLVVGMGVFLGATFFAVVLIAVRAMRTPVVTGRESLIGKTGSAVSDIDPTGTVQVAGERWSAKLAEGAAKVHTGERVIVTDTAGIKLIVKKE